MLKSENVGGQPPNSIVVNEDCSSTNMDSITSIMGILADYIF